MLKNGLSKPVYIQLLLKKCMAKMCLGESVPFNQWVGLHISLKKIMCQECITLQISVSSKNDGAEKTVGIEDGHFLPFYGVYCKTAIYRERSPISES